MINVMTQLLLQKIWPSRIQEQNNFFRRDLSSNNQKMGTPSFYLKWVEKEGVVGSRPWKQKGIGSSSLESSNNEREKGVNKGKWKVGWSGWDWKLNGIKNRNSEKFEWREEVD